MNEDRVIQKLIGLDEKIDKLVTQDSFDEFCGDVTNTLDAHTKMLERLDQERLSSIERMNRIEDDVQRLKSHPKPA